MKTPLETALPDIVRVAGNGQPFAIVDLEKSEDEAIQELFQTYSRRSLGCLLGALSRRELRGFKVVVGSRVGRGTLFTVHDLRIETMLELARDALPGLDWELVGGMLIGRVR